MNFTIEPVERGINPARQVLNFSVSIAYLTIFREGIVA